jgi:predicted nucleic acid-binding protein
VNFLLDTNVLSEMRKPKADKNVFAWLDATSEDRIFVSVVSIAEIQRGILSLEDGRRKKELESWFRGALLTRFENRIVPICPAVALVWGEFVAGAKRGGFGLGLMDAALAATASVHSLCLATRNVKDFRRLNVEIFNPWAAHEGA